MRIVILGLSITSSWGNGHATTYRGLVRELSRRGHDVLFLERDVPWYAENRDLPCPPYGTTELYADVPDLISRFHRKITEADVVILGSYVPEGIAVANWIIDAAGGIRAFYDIDTPVTFAALERGNCEYLAGDQVRRFDLYLSFTGGPILRKIERHWQSPCARALYCSFDPDTYFPEPHPIRWSLGYLGTYSADRQPKVERLLNGPAHRRPDDHFVVAGPLYPPEIMWPENVERIEHLSPAEHRQFYNSQKFTLNVTRADMVRSGYSPSVRLFEAAACGTAIVSDYWEGIDELFVPGKEILIAENGDEVMQILGDHDSKRKAIGAAARDRVMGAHTARHRAMELEQFLMDVSAPVRADRSVSVSPGRIR